MAASKWTVEDLKFWGLLVAGGTVVVLAAVYILPPIITLLKLPGEILDLPGKAIDKAKQNQKDSASDAAKYQKAKLEAQKTTIPGMSLDSLAKIIDKKILAKFNSVPVRDSAHSNSKVLKYVSLNNPVGYVYSVANEKLGSKNITWIYITDVVNGEPYGWIRLQDVSIPGSGIAGIGCASCNGISCLSCNKNIHGFQKILN